MLTRRIRIIVSLILLSPLPAFANPNNEVGSGRPKSPWWSSSTPSNGYPKSPPGSTWVYPPEPQPDPTPSDFERLSAREAAEWKQLEQEVLKKFDRYMQSSQKVWVDYSDRRDAMTHVDFETGEVQIEGMVEAGVADVRAAAAHLISKTAQALTQKRDLNGKPMMQTFFSTEAMDAIDGARLSPIIEETPVVGSDGVRRFKVRVALKMADDHLKRRAERYFSRIQSEAQKLGVDPALVTAVMHTESAFNPMARSNAPAFGLMQLVPRFAGREAYRRLYGVDAILSPDYLYRPESNIALGVAYLALLDRVYFKEVSDPVKRRYLVICAYNWGPTALKKMLRPMRVQAMDAPQLFDLLQERIPLETRNYLKQVEARRAAYRASFL
jgi:membrane-bound lytic murein transglycosylase C